MTEPGTPPSLRDVEYKGAPLDAAKGPGLGCFWSQVVVLVVLLILTPLSVSWDWPTLVSGLLLISVLLLLLFTGQTVIFLLRLVAADRRATGRRRPLASGSPTVGELEDRQPGDEAGLDGTGPAGSGQSGDLGDEQSGDPGDEQPGAPGGGVRE